MKTKADEHRDDAKLAIQDAIEHLSKIVVERCSGTDDYRIDYLPLLKQAMMDLIEIRDTLSPL